MELLHLIKLDTEKMKRQLCSTIVTKFQGKKLIWIFEFANAGLFHSFVNNSF